MVGDDHQRMNIMNESITIAVGTEGKGEMERNMIDLMDTITQVPEEVDSITLRKVMEEVVTTTTATVEEEEPITMTIIQWRKGTVIDHLTTSCHTDTIGSTTIITLVGTKSTIVGSTA